MIAQAWRHGFDLPSWKAGRPDDGLVAAAPGRRTLRVYFIKPSRYDDDGRVLRFRWGVIPNNTLSVLAGLNQAYAAAHPEVAVETVLWDEMIDGVLSAPVLASIRDRARAAGAEPIVGLAGVQTNQYPRARDLALQLVRIGVPVVMGGFHVTSDAPSRDFLIAMRITVVVGEAETTWSTLLDDYRAGRLRERYHVGDGIRAKTGGADIVVPPIAAAPLPAVDGRYTRRFFNPTFSTLDTSRGCPFVCSYCSVKNVMGRTMRARDPGAVVEWMRDAHDRHGIRNLLIVDDDLYRSPQWEPILSGMAALRRQGRDLSCVIQVDIESAAFAHRAPDEPETALHRRSRRFVELAAAAGCFEVFMGFESFSPQNLEHTLKFHNEDRRDRRRTARDPAAGRARIKARYRRVVAAWHAAGVGVHSGYIIGLPFDGPGCGAQAARDLTEIGIDIASFFAYTPLPGTEDHDRAVADGAIVERDFNAYDSTHFVQTHPLLDREALAREYRDAYRQFYGWRRLAWSLATFHRVPGLGSTTRAGMLTQQVYFTYATRRGWHPMMGGIWRLHERDERRRAVSDDEAAALYSDAAAAPR